VDALGHLVLVEVGDRAVERRGADEGVDAGRAGVRTASQQRSMSLKLARARPQTEGVAGGAGDLAHGAEVALGGDREARLDDVHAHLVEEAGDLELLLVGHGGAGRLLAVAERGVEDADAVGGGHDEISP
jgi:hypothetical protein